MQTDAISRSAVLETINEVDISDCTDVYDIIDRVYADVANVPTIDAVPVIRCKDCKKRGSEMCPMRYEEYCGWGFELRDFTKDDGYCSYAEKSD